MQSVLVVTPEFPWPLDSGSKIREYYCIKTLGDQFDVTLISLADESIGSAAVSAVESLGVEVVRVDSNRSMTEAVARSVVTRTPYRAAKFGERALTQAVRDHLDAGEFDLVWAHFLETVTTVPEDSDCPVVLDQHNAERTYWESFDSGSLPLRLYARLNIRWLGQLQATLSDRIDAVLSIDETDAAEARSWANAPVIVTPNGVDTETFSPATPTDQCGHSVLFVGSLDTRMNEEAVKWFVRESWPSIRSRVPDATFSIVGRNPTDRVRGLAKAPGVDVVGGVDDVVPHYDGAAVFVAPFALGGGSKLKILEALSMERFLVTTPVGAKGIDIENGRHALVCERNSAFADAVVEALRRNGLELGAAGRRLVEQSYAWDQIYEQTMSRLRTAVDF